MNDKYSTTEGKTSEKLSDEAMLSAQWKNIDWHKAEREVNRLQIRIVKATQQKDYNAVKRLQYLLTHSFYAKALAVKRVVTNDGRKTPGVDGVLWNTPAKKMKAVLSLTDKGYRARPLRRVYIEKKDKKKKRPLGIPTMYDRAMQALYALALEPVAETTADGKSFGFRKGRCAQDACEYLFNAHSPANAPASASNNGGADDRFFAHSSSFHAVSAAFSCSGVSTEAQTTPGRVFFTKPARALPGPTSRIWSTPSSPRRWSVSSM